jgi:23S rRNA (adenine2503-C2)-methyltransferase
MTSPPPRQDDRLDLRTLDLRTLDLPALTREITERLGEKPFRARQIHRWLHQRNAATFEEMTDLSKDLRVRLAAAYRLDTLTIGSVQRSRDGTVKFRLVTVDGRSVEAVYIPEWKDRPSDDVAPDGLPDRRTLCVSSQVGCAMGCGFCMTATMGLIRQMTAGEIVDQVYRVNAWLQSEGAPWPRPVTNLVFMGMGEPLHNYENLKAALDLLLSPDGSDFSHRHVTVSTSGLAPQLERLGRETDVKIAISLTGTTDAVRDRLMPVNRRYPIETLLEVCRQMPLRRGRRITFEYVLLAGETDAPEDADRLAALLAGVPAKVNLIAYNENDGLPFRRPEDGTVTAFRERLARRGLTAVVRRSRGRDIDAACGQLAVAESRSNPGASGALATVQGP